MNIYGQNKHTRQRLSFGLIVFLLMLCSLSPIETAIKSSSGNIRFDTNNDGTYELILSANGLGIGVEPSSNLHVQGNAVISQRLTVGGTSNSSQSNLHINGTLAYGVTTYTTGTNTISDTSLVLADTSQGNVVLTLPDANDNQVLTIKRISTNNTLFIVAGGNTIDASSSLIYSSGNLSTVSLVSSNGSWYITSEGSGTESVGLNSDNVFLHWNLDETSGNTASDSSPTATRTGNLTNDLSFSGNTITGVLDSALKLGNSDTVEYSNGGLSATGYSYSIWVNYSGASSATLDTEPNIQGKAGFAWASSNTLYHMSAFHQLDASGNYASTALTSTANLAANTWYHIAATWDGSNLNLYLNGQYESGNTATTWVAGTNIMATNPGVFEDSTIKIDDVRFFDKALSSDQIQSLYYLGSQ